MTTEFPQQGRRGFACLCAALAIALPILAGCAATVERGGASAGSATPSASGNAALPSMKIPATAAGRLVLNMQLAPQHPKDSGWTTFRQEWHDIGKEQATLAKIAFGTQDGDAKPTGEEGTLVVVKVADYKHVGTGARIMLGVMTGNAYINSKVEFRDLKTGQPYGERSYDMTSSAWQGIFAPTTPKQIYTLVDEIIAEMKRG